MYVVMFKLPQLLLLLVMSVGNVYLKREEDLEVYTLPPNRGICANLVIIFRLEKRLVLLGC